ncbi:unnamed protein product [Didymodactylos carnosus]|uniref:Uncharacterized protein n=1 Tax=Didymodactylos carnosus TaxID=1234261 RepID=A0A813NFT6_9BILA|nr:unnamed protein product [Didymodactylos carnosus]CAF0763591.1 unnamed protein product [Didymodactylos carnosus]CAF3517143.1 unnamed protein product [Didymodactylos carnosus]CAF3543559.1 unnamed protein product [Didymodactylos carnosus]
MCSSYPATDPTADYILSDLLTVTEDLVEFSINVLDIVRLQIHFNDRNRRVNLGLQLKEHEQTDRLKYGFVHTQKQSCSVSTTLKYDLALHLRRILQTCKRTKANLLLLRVSRFKSGNNTLLLVASTDVRVEELSKKIKLLIRLVKQNGGEFKGKFKKKTKKKHESEMLIEEESDKQQQEEGGKQYDTSSQKAINSKENVTLAESTQNYKEQEKKKPKPSLMTKDDLNDYVELTLSFKMVVSKYREFIKQIRYASTHSISRESSIANSIILVPIASNAITELNNIINRLMHITYTLEAESNYSRQPLPDQQQQDQIELYRGRRNNNNRTVDSYTQSQMMIGEHNLKNLYEPERLSKHDQINRLTKSRAENHHVNEQNIRRSKASLNNQREGNPASISRRGSWYRNQSALRQQQLQPSLESVLLTSTIAPSFSLDHSSVPNRFTTLDEKQSVITSNFKLTQNMIANIFGNFFNSTNLNDSLQLNDKL